MTTIFNPWIVNGLTAGTLVDAELTGYIGMALMHQWADLGVAPPASLSALLALPGFQEISQSGYRRTAKQSVVAVSGGIHDVIVGANWDSADPADPPPWITAPINVAAGVWYMCGVGGANITIDGVVNPWLFASDDMFGNKMTPGAIIGNPGTPKTLMRYSFNPASGVATPGLGVLYQAPGPTIWESARTQHVYMYPQRVNWVPNPSFEDVGLFGWRANGTLTRRNRGVDSQARFHGEVNGTQLESVAVPRNPTYRFSAYVRTMGQTNGSPGAGRANAWVQLGLQGWDSSFSPWSEAYGPQRLLYSDWTRYDEILTTSEDIAVVVPTIKADGPFDVDMVLLESTVGLHDYFDGDSETGNPGDFSWQGNAAQTYSFWYNARYTTAARLYGGYFNGMVTKPCLLEEWLPSYTAVMTHWDVLSVGDTKHPLEDWGSRVIP